MPYPGGKAGDGTYQLLINQIPPHERYVELFAGGAAVLRHKRAAAASIAVESDPVPARALRALEIPGLEVMEVCALRWLDAYKPRPGDFLFADPPYLMESRSSKREIYRREFHRPAQHRALLERLKRLPVPVMLCGYSTPLYQLALAGWRTLTYSSVTRGGSVAEEWLWMSYPEPLELHDYRYLGAGYRERERIKRKKLRWRRRLQEMPALERFAVLAASEELRSRPASSGDEGLVGRPGGIAADGVGHRGEYRQE